MAAITYRTFVDGLEGLTITGVKRQFTKGVPATMQTTSLPAQYVRTPGNVASAVTEIGLAFGGSGRLLHLRADLVVVVEAMGQNTQGANFDAMVTMVDSVNAALESDTAHILATGSPTWETRYELVMIGEVVYHAVVAAVEVIA